MMVLHRARRRRSDRGFTLPELLITMTISGVLLGAISAALIMVLRTSPRIQQSVAESKDVSFVQTWVPIDLSSASSIETSPTFSPATSTTLPGTNALTIRRWDISGETAVEFQVAYRYVFSIDEWQLVRYEVRNAGTAAETVTKVGVAHELAPPPTGWTPVDAPEHAIVVRARNGEGSGSSQGYDVTVTFVSGETFKTGGANIGEGSYLPANPDIGFVDPTAPPSRCGGTIVMVLDSSGSVPGQGGGTQLKDAAIQFMEAFKGTPTRFGILGFDYSAYPIYPSAAGSYFALLDNTAQVNAATSAVNAMTWDKKWYSGIPGNGYGTNWEHGLYLPFWAPDDVPWPSTPDLVVFVTDGDPNRKMVGTNGASDRVYYYEEAVNPAIMRADRAVAAGAKIIGVLVGNASSSSASAARLKQVVGPVEFNAAANGGAGNAAQATFFKASFVNAATVMKQIMAAQCGGTITVQKRIQLNGVLEDPPTNTSWEYSTDTGSRPLDIATASSVTFDYTFAGGTNSKTIRLTESEAPPGYLFDRFECTVAGVSVSSRVTQPITENGVVVPGADIQLQADEAMSCISVSVPA
jgi:prepilin-type N-terminal cleavage/methylation domain-containing protein